MRIFIFLLCFLMGAALWAQDFEPIQLALMDNRHNVLYLGIENPITVAVSGVSPRDIRVTAAEGSGLRVRSTGQIGQYKLSPSKRTVKGTFAYLNITQISTNKLLARMAFRVKRIPDPVVVLTNGKTDGRIPAAEMRIQKGVIAKIPDFYFDASCRIQGFTLYYSKAGQDPVEILNRGGRFEAKALQLVQNAQAGDIFQIVNVKGRCPSESCGRKLNGLAFEII